MMASTRNISDITTDIRDVHIKINDWYHDWVGAERGSVWAREEMAALKRQLADLRAELRYA